MANSTHAEAPGLATVRAEIERACREAGRDPSGITLIAVGKTFGADAIEPVIAAGQKVFGENRVQEANAKWPALKAKYPGVELHMIGSLQSNKAKEAVALFDAIHSLDRQSLAEALAKEISKQGRRPRLFVEVNAVAEPRRGVQGCGCFSQSAAAGSSLGGLMCIAPAEEAPAPRLHSRRKSPHNGLKLLSMGMSGDFPVAIAINTCVGTAILVREKMQKSAGPFGCGPARAVRLSGQAQHSPQSGQVSARDAKHGATAAGTRPVVVSSMMCRR
jgi:pyridoxal phosphate enzyme (YggS family)